MEAIQRLFSIFFLLVLFAGLTSCKKTYLTDGGITTSANTNLSTYDYLKNDQYQRFDTVITLIDHFKLKDSINKSITCFAFTDYSVKNLMTSLQVTSLNQLTDSVTSKLITQYLFSIPLTLENTSITALPYDNLAGSKAPCGIKNVYYVNLINSSPAFDYYTLNYIKINGVLDGSANAPANDKIDVNLPCQTTGIKTSSGSTLHILVNSAQLNKL